MSNKVNISTVEEYDYCISRGYEPLANPLFILPISLRIEMQQRKFGIGNTIEANSKFYRFAWDNRPHRCEECFKPLHDYSAIYVSHILSRGAHPAMAYDIRNTNILCFKHHNQWETGNRKGMRIYNTNERIKDVLLSEYRGK